MNWVVFCITVSISAFLVYPGFEIAQVVSIRKGEIPARGVHIWKGRPFLHWSDFATQLYGDLIFFSLLNGFVAIAFQSVQASEKFLLFLLASILGFAITFLWIRLAQRVFASPRFNRWDWHFTSPAGRLTVGGKYHVFYFFLESVILVIAFGYLIWQPIDALLRIGILTSSAGYLVALLRDVWKLGLLLEWFIPAEGSAK
ncbi:MAG: hypothetical protein Q7S50_03550 [bacterium]|nr:hypothetical protein [bacterium]